MTNAYDINSAHIFYPVGATPPFTRLPRSCPASFRQRRPSRTGDSFLASWGFVVLTIGTSNPNTGGSDTTVPPPVREAALLNALTTLQGENTRSGSPLAGQLDLTRQGVAGWSMGGGGTLLAANSTPSLKAVFAMEPWNPEALPIRWMKCPAHFFAWHLRWIGRAAYMPLDQYQSIPSTTPKILYEVMNGRPLRVDELHELRERHGARHGVYPEYRPPWAVVAQGVHGVRRAVSAVLAREAHRCGGLRDDAAIAMLLRRVVPEPRPDRARGRVALSQREAFPAHDFAAGSIHAVLAVFPSASRAPGAHRRTPTRRERRDASVGAGALAAAGPTAATGERADAMSGP